MPTVLAVVTRALRLLRVVDPNESPEAVSVVTAIDALNPMMMRWEANGISLGWSPVQSGDEDLPAPAEAEQAITFNLAATLRPEYGVTLDPEIYAIAEAGLADLRRDVAVANPMSWDRCGSRYNTRTDQYD